MRRAATMAMRSARGTIGLRPFIRSSDSSVATPAMRWSQRLAASVRMLRCPTCSMSKPPGT